MAKKAKNREKEQQYIKRARKLRDNIKSVSRRTPWTEFFKEGPGAELETDIPKSSIHSIVYSYGRKLGKKFVCSYETQNDGVVVVTLESIERRD